MKKLMNSIELNLIFVDNGRVYNTQQTQEVTKTDYLFKDSHYNIYALNTLTNIQIFQNCAQHNGSLHI